MNEAFDRDPFSWSFNTLRNIWLWNVDASNPFKKTFSRFLVVLAFFYRLSNACLGLIDLYLSRNDMMKVAYNLCTTTLTFGVFVKNFHLMLLWDRLDKLRLSLFEDGRNLREPEDLKIKDSYLRILLIQRKIFYWAAFILLPAWLVCSLTSLKWGPRELPFPVYLPLDLEDDLQYAFGFFYHCLGSIYSVTEAIQADMAMFSIFLQITAHFEMLADKILTIDEMYANTERCLKTNKEINKTLVDRKTKQILKDCVRRHLVLMEYTKELEFCYNKPMMEQLAGIFLLTLGNGLELIVISMNFSLKLSYQIGYTLVIIGDVFMICYLADRLKTRCLKVVRSFYKIAWYYMSNDVRKEILLVITGSQKAVELTAGKMFKLDLTTFLGLMKHIYSWLALFAQVLTKK